MSTDPKLIDKLSSSLPPSALRIIEGTRRIADKRQLRAFLVGGTVRDLLLGRPPLDVDVVIEGDALSLAGEVCDETGALLVKQTRFGTATLRLGETVVDFATARSETYAHPGALPVVAPSAITADLRRRDFTINAIALQISGADAGRLIDPASGQADLAQSLIRVLHDGSFRDDATRMLRAARYEARFGFHMEDHTLEILRSDLRCLAAISPARIRQELMRIMAEPEPERALRRLDELGVLRGIHQSLVFDDASAAAAARLRAICAQARLAPSYWPVFCGGIGPRTMPAVIARLRLMRREATLVEAMPKLLEAGRSLAATCAPSKIAELLEPFPPAAVAAFAARAESPVARDQAIVYLTRLRQARPILRGSDLIRLGVPPGPEVGIKLATLRAAKLDGVVRSRRDEERFVLESLTRQEPSGGR